MNNEHGKQNVCMGLIRMFSISIPINSTINLPESEKSGRDLRNKDYSFTVGNRMRGSQEERNK